MIASPARRIEIRDIVRAAEIQRDNMVCLHFFDKIDCSVIQIPLIMFPKYKYHVFLSASLRFFSFSLGFLLFVFSSQIRNL